MITIDEVRKKLEGRETDRAYISEMVKQYGNLSVKIALLANASIKKLFNPFWIGCPPGIFLSYKWNGPASRDYVQQLHDYLTGLGYHVFFDRNELSEDADTYTSVPEFISNVANCQYYLIVLTEKTAEYITARTGKTSWIFDEYQQAVTLVNNGRMGLVPVVVEEGGKTDFFTEENTINLVDNIYNFKKLDDLFYPVRFNISPEYRIILSDVLDGFDARLTQQRWQDVADVFDRFILFKNIPDYQFRMLIYSLCQSNFAQAKESYKLCEPFVGPGQLPRLLRCYAEIYHLPVAAQNLQVMNVYA
ncbi:MAG: TIR domain-containing protein [Flavisolibacter sp.]